jgi:hypothetical protein
MIWGPKTHCPVSGAAFRDDDRNSIKMILTIAAPAAMLLAGAPLFVDSLSTPGTAESADRTAHPSPAVPGRSCRAPEALAKTVGDIKDRR